MTRIARRLAEKRRALEERLHALAAMRSALACQMAELHEATPMRPTSPIVRRVPESNR